MHLPQEPWFRKYDAEQAVQLPLEPDVQVLQLAGQLTQTRLMVTVLVGHVFTEFQQSKGVGADGQVQRRLIVWHYLSLNFHPHHQCIQMTDYKAMPPRYIPQEPVLRNVLASHALQLPSAPDVQLMQLDGQSTQAPLLAAIFARHVLPVGHQERQEQE